MVSSVMPQTASLKLKVAAVQFRSSFDVAENRRRILETLEHLAEQGVKVAAFPECALTGYRIDVNSASAEEVTAAEEEIRQTCRHRKIAGVVGSIYRVNGRTYDTAVVFDSRGELVERYGKVMLAGEKWATPGNHIAFFELGCSLHCHHLPRRAVSGTCSAACHPGCACGLLHQLRVRHGGGGETGSIPRRAR